MKTKDDGSVFFERDTSSVSMPNINDPEEVSVEVRCLWYLWGFNLATQIGLLVITGWFVLSTGGIHFLPIWCTWLPVLILAIAWPASHIVRSQIYKSYWRGDAVSLEGYSSAFWCKGMILNVVSLVGIFSFIFAGTTWPALTAVCIGLLIQITGYPTATPMQPQAPRLGVRDERYG